MEAQIDFLTSLSVKNIISITTYETVKSDYPMHNAGRFSCGLMFTLEGNEIYRYDGKDISAEEGSVLFLPQGLSYSIRLNSAISKVKMINFTASGEIKEPYLFKIKNSEIIKNLFLDAERIWNKNDITASIQCKALFYTILHNTAVGVQSYLPEKKLQQIRTGVEYIMQHFTDANFRIETVSEKCALSQKYFNTIFFKTYHCTPKDYVTNLRINKAKELLKNKNLSVNEISEKLGYCDCFHFSKVFKKKTGLSPLQYKKTTEIK